MPFSFLFLSSLFFLSTCFRRMAAYYAVKSANDRKAKKAAFDKIFARFDHNHNGEKDISSTFLQLSPFRKGFCERLLWGAAPGRPWSRRGGSSEVDSFCRRRRSSHKGWIQNLLQTFRALSKLGQVSHKSFYRKYFLTQESRWSGVGFGDDQQDPVGVQGPWQEQRWLHLQERVQWDLKVSHQGAGHSWKHTKLKQLKAHFPRHYMLINLSGINIFSDCYSSGKVRSRWRWEAVICRVQETAQEVKLFWKRNSDQFSHSSSFIGMVC